MNISFPTGYCFRDELNFAVIKSRGLVLSSAHFKMFLRHIKRLAKVLKSGLIIKLTWAISDNLVV